jgi:hypothetical protein
VAYDAFGVIIQVLSFGGVIFRVVLHGIISQKTGIIINIAVKRSNIALVQTVTNGLHDLVLRLRSRGGYLRKHFPKCVERGLSSFALLR